MLERKYPLNYKSNPLGKHNKMTWVKQRLGAASVSIKYYQFVRHFCPKNSNNV